MRPYRPVSADSKTELAAEPAPVTRRSPGVEERPKQKPPPPPREDSVDVFRRAVYGTPPELVTRYVAPHHHVAPPPAPRPRDEIPVEVDVPSIAPVALATPGDARLFPVALSASWTVPPAPLPPPPRSSPARALIAFCLFALGLAITLAVGIVFLSRPSWVARAKGIASDLVARKSSAQKASVPVAAAAPASEPVPGPPSTVVVAPPPPPPDPRPAIDPDSTLVTLPPYAKGHRVFVDGTAVTPDDAGVATVACGRHALRIGATGRARTVTLPCGAAITLR
jgi:hypothetical protein